MDRNGQAEGFEPENINLILERLQLRWRGIDNVELLDGNIPVPVALEHRAERAWPDARTPLDLLCGNLPLVIGVMALRCRTKCKLIWLLIFTSPATHFPLWWWVTPLIYTKPMTIHPFCSCSNLLSDSCALVSLKCLLYFKKELRKHLPRCSKWCKLRVSDWTNRDAAWK